MLGKLFASSSSVEALKSYNLPNNNNGGGVQIMIVQGSVLDFSSKKGAIVNSANEECLQGGGVDHIISKMGGPKLLEDRKALPRLPGGIRCPKGGAKITGPNNYGKIKVPYVIHAVGPNYKDYNEDDVATPNELLRSAYQSALDCTLQESAQKKPIQKVAFSLLSAGRYKGDQSLEHVLGIGVQAIYDWCQDKEKTTSSPVKQILLYAYNSKEATALTELCDRIIGG